MKVKKIRFIAMICCGLTALLWVTVTSANQEEEVTLDQVPEAVRATIMKESAGARITEIERETRDGVVTYEAEFIRNGQELEIQIAPDGTVLGREVETEEDGEDDLGIEQVPEPARSALIRLAAGNRILEAEREREDGVMVYEASWIANGTRHEAAVTADGDLIETEEIIPSERAPAAVQSAIAQHFGPGVRVTVAKKMIVVYELEARVDGREKEMYVFPTGRVHMDDDDDEDEDDD